MKGILIFAASIAIFTTVGIVLSMLFETGHFFSPSILVAHFFFAPPGRRTSRAIPNWACCRCSGARSMSFIALLVAVPIGLFAAIYLAEYAGPRMRSLAKPMLEVLAGIPTIVYGLFAKDHRGADAA